MSKTSLIGIDLGTSNSCVGVFVDGKVEIIANDWGNKTTPSYVAFTDTQTLVGDAAESQMNTNLSNTVFDSKRMIGEHFNNHTIQSGMKHWPFTVVSDEGKPKFKVEYKGETKQFSPEEIFLKVLSKMKDIAEKYLKNTVTKAVLTVPTTFNYTQREAIKKAATMSSLNVIRIISETTAAAIAYGFDRNGIKEGKVLIFDLGGGYLDLSIVSLVDRKFVAISHFGDKRLGGEDFDNRIVNHFIEEFKRKHNKDLSVNKSALSRLRTACERAKRTLSTSTQASIEIDFEGIDFYSTITRNQFEVLNDDLFQSIIITVRNALIRADIHQSQIDDIVLVGGSTRIPKIQKLLQDFIYGKELNTSNNAEESVATGAAICAAFLNGEKFEFIENFTLLE